MLGQGHTFCHVQAASRSVSWPPSASLKEPKYLVAEPQTPGMLASSLWRSALGASHRPVSQLEGCSLPKVCNWTEQPQHPCFLRAHQPPPSRALATHPDKRAAAPEPGQPEDRASCLRRLVESLATAGTGCWTSEHALGAGGEQRR